MDCIVKKINLKLSEFSNYLLGKTKNVLILQNVDLCLGPKY